MKLNFFKKKKQSTALVSSDDAFKVNLPEVFRGMQAYESDSDRFCTFDEDYFFGENYEISKVRIKRIIPPPKTPPAFYFGIVCGAISILLISASISFLTLFSKFGGIYKSVTVPNFTSLTEDEAVDLIKNSYDYFDYSIEYKENPNISGGSVISQIPKPATTRKLYGINGHITIKLTVSKPTKTLTLPNLIGQNARDVALELKNAGINVYITKIYSSNVKTGKIISSSHPEGSLLQKNETVYITESLGKKISYVNVPTLIGISETDAITKLKKANLTLNKVIYKSSPLPIGTVIDQSIKEGSSVKEGSKITLSVSGGPFTEE